MTEYKVKVYGTRTEWYNLEGNPHRLDGPAIEWADGSKSWWINGKRHRENGPAIEYADGSKLWYINGKLHRIDGPAVEYADGCKLWYINNKYYTETEFNEYINKQNKPCLGKKVIVDGIEYELR